MYKIVDKKYRYNVEKYVFVFNVFIYLKKDKVKMNQHLQSKINVYCGIIVRIYKVT